MAVNPYSQPAQAQFINTYVPIPFEEMVQAGQNRQQRYDTNRKAFEDQVNAARQLQAMPGADREYIEGTVIPTMDELADKYGTQDYGEQEVIRNINRDISSNIDRRLVQNIQGSYKGYQEYQKQKAAMEAKGTPVLQSSLVDPSQYSTKEQGLFSSTPSAELDWRTATDKFFDDIKDTYLGETNLSGGRKGLVHGVTPKALMQHANDNVGVWLQDPANRQKVGDLRAQGWEGSDTDIAKAFLLPQAEEYARKKVSSIYDPNSTSGHKDPDAPDVSSFVTDKGVAATGNVSRRKQRKTMKKVKDYANYSVGFRDTKTGEKVSRFKAAANKLNTKIVDILNLDDEYLKTMLGQGAVDALHKKYEAVPEFESQEGKNNLTAIAARAAAWKGMDLQDLTTMPVPEANEIMDEYLEDFQTRKRHADVKEISNPEFAKYMNNQILAKDTRTGTMVAAKRHWYDPSQGETPNYDYNDPNKSTGFTPLDDITKEYPMNTGTKETKGKYKYYVSGELSPYNNMMPSGYTVDIVNDNGETVKQVYMSGPERNEGPGALETSERQNALRHTLYKQIFDNPTGLISLTETYKGKPYRISGMSIQDGFADLDVRDSKGNVVGTLSIRGGSPDEAMRAAEEELSNIFSNL